MNWQCWLFPWDRYAPGIERLVGTSIATKRLKVGSKQYFKAVEVISTGGGGEIRLSPVFEAEALTSFELFKIKPQKIFTVSDRMYHVNRDHIEKLKPYKIDEYGECKDRQVFYSNKPKLKDNQFCVLDFSDHILAPSSFKIGDVNCMPLKSEKSEIWSSHHVLNTNRVAGDFLIDESVDIVPTDEGFKRPLFKGLITLKLENVSSLGPLFKLPGSTDFGDSFWGCSREFYDLYSQSDYTGLKFEPILLHQSEIYEEYISEWSQIMKDLNKLAHWKSML